MTFDWSQYLDIARRIAVDESMHPEGRLRCAVSRGYYAAFNHARTYLALRGVTFGGGAGDHEHVRVQLRSDGRADLADDLYLMRRWRNAADYDARSADFRLAWIGTERGASRIIASLEYGR